MERLPTPIFWPGEFHGLYSPWGRKELVSTATFTFHIFEYIGISFLKQSSKFWWLWLWQYWLAELLCTVCFPPLYQTHPADHFSFSHIGTFKSHIFPAETRTQWLFTCLIRKMSKSTGPSGGKPCYSGDTVRAAYYDRCNSHVLSWAEPPQEERKVCCCPNHCVMPMGAPWTAAPLSNLSTFWPWTKWSPLWVCSTLTFTEHQPQWEKHASSYFSNHFHSLFKCCLLQEECANWKVWGEIKRLN